MSGYRNNEPFRGQQPTGNQSQMYQGQQINNNNFNSPRGFPVANQQQGFQQGPSQNYNQNQGMMAMQTAPRQQGFQQQPHQQNKPMQQTQQMYQARPQQTQMQPIQQYQQQHQQQPRPQQNQLMGGVAGGFQQQQGPPQQQFQQQQPPRGFQGMSNPGRGSGEWEQFFSQSNSSIPNAVGGSAVGGGMNAPSQYGMQQHQNQNQHQNQHQSQQNMGGLNNLDHAYRGGGMNVSDSMDPSLQQQSTTSYGPRGPRAMGSVPRGRGGPRGGFDPNSSGRGFSGRAPRGFANPNQEPDRYDYGGNNNQLEYDPYQSNTNDLRQGGSGGLQQGFSNQSQGYQQQQPQQSQQSWQGQKQDNYGMNNQVNSNFSSNNFSRNNSQFDQNFTNQSAIPQQQQVPYSGGMAASSAGGNAVVGGARAGKWSAQYENPLGFNGGPTVGNSNNNAMNSSNSNYPSNSATRQPSLSQQFQQQGSGNNVQHAPMSTAMKIMQTVIPRHARPSIMANTNIGASNSASTSFEPSSYPRPIRKSFPRGADSGVIGRKRERSRSKSPHARSRSPSSLADRGGRGRGRGRGFGRDTSPGGAARPSKRVSRSPPRTLVLRSSSPPTSAPAASAVAGGNTGGKLEISTLTAKDLVEDMHLPAVLKNLQSLSMLDISSKFPKLYIPADFTDLKLDWTSITSATIYDFFFNLSASAPIVFENTPSTLKQEESEIKGEEGDESVGVTERTHGSGKFYSDILEPSKFSYVASNTFNNMISENIQYHDRFINTEKPIKFNAKVLVCCGLKDPETERIDHNYCRKLRMLCGRRKGSILLLGTCWNAELDGGDPLTDRTCLLNTARRALLAQSLLDIARGDPTQNLVKLCEVNYHRPKEEIKGRVYPEQEEVTAIYVYSIQKNLLDHYTQEDFDDDWTIFSSRVKGDYVGPMLSRTIDDYLEDWAVQKPKLLSNISTGVTAKDSTTTKSAPESPHKDGHEVDESKPSNADTIAKEDTVKADEKFVEKPDSPSVLLCPMPLPPNIANDPSKKQEALSLRMVPLSTILSYTPDDCSERIFEASIAAEVLKSCISLNYANIIVDFIISMNGSLVALADQRVAAAVKRLKELNVTTRNKTVSSAKAVTPGSAESKQGEEIVPTEGEASGKTSTDKEVMEVENAEAEESEETGKIEESNNEPVVVQEVNENAIVSEDHSNEQPEPQALLETTETLHSQQTAESKEEVEEQSLEFIISDDEARTWRRRFVAACRWFDVKQERFLRLEQLQLIFYVSQRHASRADAVSSIEDVLGESDNKLRYETCI